MKKVINYYIAFCIFFFSPLVAMEGQAEREAQVVVQNDDFITRIISALVDGDLQTTEGVISHAIDYCKRLEAEKKEQYWYRFFSVAFERLKIKTNPQRFEKLAFIASKLILVMKEFSPHTKRLFIDYFENAELLSLPTMLAFYNALKRDIHLGKDKDYLAARMFERNNSLNGITSGAATKEGKR